MAPDPSHASAQCPVPQSAGAITYCVGRWSLVLMKPTRSRPSPSDLRPLLAPYLLSPSVLSLG
jgi:hypothetical protein